MEPAIIPTANRPQFENGAYDNLVDSQARNYTVALVLSDQQVVMMGYNVKDLGEDTVAQGFRAIVERQGTSVKNAIGVRQN